MAFTSSTKMTKIVLALTFLMMLTGSVSFSQKTRKPGSTVENKSNKTNSNTQKQTGTRGLSYEKDPAKTVTVSEKASEGKKPELVIQNGHSDAIRAVAFSRDGKLLATGGEDNTIKLWNVATGRLIQNFEGHTDFVRSIVFSSAGNTFASGGNDRSVNTWDINSGKLIHSHQFHSDLVTSLDYSRDGRTIASASHDGHIKLWDASSGNLIDTLGDDTDGINAIAFSPDGKVIASGGFDKKVHLWDVKTRSEIRSFGKHSEAINAVAFSPDGRRVASAGNDKAIRIWDSGTGSLAVSFEGLAATISAIVFSPDGKTLVSTGKDRAITIYDLDSRKSIGSLQGHSLEITCVALSPDGKTIASGSRDQTARLWDKSSGKLIYSLEGHSSPVTTVAVSPDGGIIASANRKGALCFWESDSGRLIRSIDAHRPEVTSIAFSPDSKSIVSGGLDKILKIWDSGSGKLIRTFQASSEADCVAFSPDGKTIASGNKNHIIYLWNAGNGKAIQEFKGHGSFVTALAFSPDGAKIASGGWDKTIKLWNKSNGKLIRSLEGHTDIVNAIAFSPDGQYVASASDDKTVKVWSVESGNLIRTLEGSTERVRALAFRPDGKSIAAGGYDDTIRLWNTDSGMLTNSLKGHSDVVSSLAFSPNGKTIVSGSWDTTTKVWAIESGRLVASLLPFNDGNWIAYNPAGYYTGSEKASHYVTWRIENRIYDFDQFFETFFRPDIIGYVFQDEVRNNILVHKPDVPPDNISDGFYNPPKVTIVSPRADQPLTSPDVEVVVAATDQGGGVYEIRLTQNGKVITSDRQVDSCQQGAPAKTPEQPRGGTAKSGGRTRAGTAASGKRQAQPAFGTCGKRGIHYEGETYTAKYRVPLAEGPNVFRVTAFSKDRTESEPYALTVNGPVQAKAPALYVLAIGINKYKNSALNLNFAAPDAKGIASYFNGKSQKLFPGGVKVVQLYDGEATRENILKEFQSLRERAEPQDVVVVYLAGHGETVGTEWYFIPSEITNPENDSELAKGGISSTMISQEVTRLAAQKILVLLDACKSGSVTTRSIEDRKAMAQLARSSGICVFAASTNIQEAGEVKELGHGIFTYLLLKGLNGEAILIKERTVTVTSLTGYVTSQMPAITQRYRTAEQYPVMNNRGQDFPLAVLN